MGLTETARICWETEVGANDDYDISFIKDATMHSLVPVGASNNNFLTKLQLQRANAMALVEFSGGMIQRASNRDSGYQVSEEYQKRMHDLREEAKFALEFDDWLVSTVRARAVLDTLIRGRQAMLQEVRALPPREFSGVPLDKPAGKVNYRIIAASKLLQLLQFGSQQQVQIIKLVALGRRDVIERNFSALLDSEIILSDSDSDEPSAIFLRASVSRNMLIYTIGIPTDVPEAWDMTACLSDASAVVFYADDISLASHPDGRQLLQCLMHVSKDNVVVSLSGSGANEGDPEVDDLFRSWIKLTSSGSGSGLSQLLRTAIYQS